jgi:hypothetical protein
MKTLLLIFCLFFGSMLFAQGNLQFNQVLIIDSTPAGNPVTVPSGKVWKIESVALSSNLAYFQIQWSGVNYFILNNSNQYANLPFWLPSNANVSMTSSANGKVSVIEFNVLP